MKRHHYPGKAVTDKIAQTDPLAAAAAAAGGTLIRAQLRLRHVGRGCGAPVPVTGTSGEAPCGAWVTDLTGRREEHLCYYCKKDIAGGEETKGSAAPGVPVLAGPRI